MARRASLSFLPAATVTLWRCRWAALWCLAPPALVRAGDAPQTSSGSWAIAGATTFNVGRCIAMHFSLHSSPVALKCQHFRACPRHCRLLCNLLCPPLKPPSAVCLVLAAPPPLLACAVLLSSLAKLSMLMRVSLLGSEHVLRAWAARRSTLQRTCFSQLLLVHHRLAQNGLHSSVHPFVLRASLSLGSRGLSCKTGSPPLSLVHLVNANPRNDDLEAVILERCIATSQHTAQRHTMSEAIKCAMLTISATWQPTSAQC